MGSKKNKKTTYRAKRIFNKYAIASLLFIVWIAFFDKNNIINQFKLRNTVLKLEKEKYEYIDDLGRAIREKAKLDGNKERYAREKYFMHKDNEDVFIIERNEE